jgi:lipopolysaccharide biosynthesis protein
MKSSSKTGATSNKQVEFYQAKLFAEQEAHKKTAIKLKSRERELHAITTSSSYKLARLIAGSKRLTKASANQIIAHNPKRVYMLASKKRYVEKVYRSNAFKSAFTGTATSELAVIIHLFYIDMLPLFAKKIALLDSANVKYDLFITIPDQHSDKIDGIKQKLPAAHIAVVPNCGRDVLPFVQVFKYIENKGYTKLLKLHTKKSPHREDGDVWRNRILDNLLPYNVRTLRTILKCLDDKRTAIIVPSQEYVSLLVNLQATAHHLKRITEKIFGKKAAEEMLRVADEYGFFGGTMFWARLEAIKPVIDNVNVEDFEPELGQEDTTLAHALERLLNLVPEMQEKAMFAVNSKGVEEIDPHTTNIPAWAEELLDEE